MLNKLLKYDLKYMIKNMSIFYILAIFFAIATRMLFSMNQTFIIYLIGQISVGCMFSMSISILFNTVIRSWIRFKDSIYKDESYLTHTLPVSKTQIYESRFLQSLLFTIVGFIVAMVSLLITYYTEERWIMLKNTINSISSGLEINAKFAIISLCGIFFLEIFNAIQSGFLGIILGYKRNNNKTVFSFLFGFITYLLSQGFVLLIFFLIGLFDSSIMNLFTTNVLLDNNLLIKLVSISIFSYLLTIILMNFICNIELKKGVNIE